MRRVLLFRSFFFTLFNNMLSCKLFIMIHTKHLLRIQAVEPDYTKPVYAHFIPVIHLQTNTFLHNKQNAESW